VKIAFFSAYYTPAIGGMMYNIETLAEKLVERGHSVTVFACNTTNSALYEEVAGIKVYRVPAWNMLNGTFPVPKPCFETFKALRKLKEWHPDVVNTQTRFFITTLVGWLFGKVLRVPVVHTERGTRHSVVSNPKVNIVSQLYDHVIGYAVTRWVSACTGVSAPACDFVKHLSGRKGMRIPNGISMGMFQGERNINGAKILFVGRLIKAKGVQDIISAMPALLEKHPEAELMIAGGGPYADALIEQAGVESIRPSIKFIGSVSRDVVVKLLKEATVFINPSYSEGLPTSVMEACAMGVPVVATNVGGTAELIDDWVTGILITPGEPWKIEATLSFLLSDPKYAWAMGKRGREKMMKEYNWESVATEYEELFKKVINRAL